MSFRPLTEAECGQPNAFAQLTSHVTRDHTFSETQGHVFPSSSDQLVEQFLQETRAVPQTFRMDDLVREMNEIESQRSLVPPVPASRVKDQLSDNAWALQYIEDGKSFNEQSNHEAIWNEIACQEQQQGNKALDTTWANEFFQESQNVSNIQQSANELVQAVDDSKLQYSKFMKFMKEVGDGQIDFNEVTIQPDASVKENADAWAQMWADQYTASNDDSFNTQFWNSLQEQWEKAAENEGNSDHPWLSEYHKTYTDPNKEYEFTDDNPMKDVQSPLEKGKELLENGDLPAAVLCFEVAVQNEPENAEAWLLLGTTQAENEQDPNAICALKRCLELEPENLKALMSLAVSYTNESYHHQACQALVSWLKCNPKYTDIVPPDFQLTGQVTSLIEPSQQKTVQDLFIKAAQRQPLDVDYEVQCGLGVLFNVSGEYDKAADCFYAALRVKPDDARLWNRLGATLANGSRPEEAVDAYHHALNLCPGFIRARYNVGITCINLNAYREAAEHFLTALNQQAKGKDVLNVGKMSQMSDSIWSTLRMCVMLMNRSDLKPFVENRDLRALNNAFDTSDN